MPGIAPAPGGERLKVPHMVWNRGSQARPHAIWGGIPDDTYFYFVHSYYAVPADPRLTVAETHYGARFTSAVAQANIFAVQFHPEKSADYGLRLRSEEHTSELQSLMRISYAVFCLKKQKINKKI